MSVSASIQKTMSLGSIQFNQSVAPSADAMIVHSIDVPAGEPGTLTTRTDADTGVVTVDDSGHSFENGDRVDVYWATGSRRGMVVSGAPSGAAVTIDGGSGDDLPSQSSDVTLVEPTFLDAAVLGTRVEALLLATAGLGQFTFVDVSDTEHYFRKLAAGKSWEWHDGNGETNPITGDSIEGVYVSHGNAAAVAMKIGVLYDNA